MKSVSRKTDASAIASDLEELCLAAAGMGLTEVGRMIGIAVLAARDAAENDDGKTAYEEVA